MKILEDVLMLKHYYRCEKVSCILVALSFHERALWLVFRNPLLLFVFGRLFSIPGVDKKSKRFGGTLPLFSFFFFFSYASRGRQ